MSSEGVSRRLVVWLGLVGTLLYVVVISWPYLQAIIVRDAAVTTWISVMSSLTSGYVTDPLYPGNRAGADGRIATVVDPQADTTGLTRARAELSRAQARLAAQQEVVTLARQTVEARTVLAASFAATFKRDLDASIAGASNNLAFISQRLELARAEASRKAALSRAGHASQSAVDAQHELITEFQRSIADTQTLISRASQRRRAADDGVFLLDDGNDAGSAMRSLEDARMRLSQAGGELAVRRTEAEEAQRMVDAAVALYARARSLAIVVPEGAMVWSLIAAPGAPVQPGAPVASWIDCRIMLVDVPVADIEIALLPKGAKAKVVLEGEKYVRTGTVLLSRGSSATIGQHDLAALAKGRRRGLGQVVVKLDPTSADVEACPIGLAAHVDFPEIGLIEIIRARLRL
jgi:multidrug resistance efflux pump